MNEEKLRQLYIAHSYGIWQNNDDTEKKVSLIINNPNVNPDGFLNINDVVYKFSWHQSTSSGTNTILRTNESPTIIYYIRFADLNTLVFGEGVRRGVFDDILNPTWEMKFYRKETR